MRKSGPANRPRGVTVLLALVLMFTGLQLLRLWVALQQAALLASLPLPVPAGYFALSAALSALAAAATAYGLARQRAWAPNATRGLALGYTAFQWADRLWLSTDGLPKSPWAFQALWGAVSLSALFVFLATPAVQAYYKKHAIRSEG